MPKCSPEEHTKRGKTQLIKHAAHKEMTRDQERRRKRRGGANLCVTRGVGVRKRELKGTHIKLANK